MKKTAIIIFLFTIIATNVNLNAENEILAVNGELPNENIEIVMMEPNTCDETVLDMVKESEVVEVKETVEVNKYKEILLDKEKKAEIKPIESNRKTKEEKQEELNRKVNESMFAITMRGTIYFKTGNSEGLLEIENIPSNLNNMHVEIHLENSGELVYTSRILNVGESIEKDTLDVVLEKGEYPAVATFKSLDTETNTVRGKVKLNILLIVEE